MQYHVMYKNISYFLLDVRANQSQSCVSSLEYWFLWKIQHIGVLYMHNVISYTHISVIFPWMFGRTGPTAREFAGVLDSFENTLSSCTLHLISSHVLRYLLFSFGCSGEPVQSCVSSLKYDSFEKYSTFVYFTCIISSHIHIYLLFSYGCSGEPADRAWVRRSIRFLWKYIIFVYFTSDIISCTQISLIFFWMFGRTSPVVREFPEVWFLWKIQHIRVLYMHNIISYTHISVIFLWMFGRTGPTAREFAGVLDSFENTLSSCTLHLISPHVHRYILFSFGCSGEPVQSCVSSLKYDSFEKYSTFVYFTCIISSHIRIYLLFSFGCSGERVRPCVSFLGYRFLWNA